MSVDPISLQANIISASQEILCNLKDLCRVHSSPPLDRLLARLNTVQQV
jgi:hypothetical protein